MKTSQTPIVLTCLLMILSLSACRAQNLRKDQVDLRQSVIELYKQQVLDNIARAAERQPMLQVSYSALSGQVVTKLTGGPTASRMDVNNTFGGPPGSAQTTEAQTRAQALSVTADYEVILNLRGDPIIDKPVYTRFVQYVRGEHPVNDMWDPTDPKGTPVPLPSHKAEDHVMISDRQPTKPVYASIEYNGKYYSIPLEAKECFFRLYRDTVFVGNPAHALGLFTEALQLVH